jgi:hypothetical protein
MDANYVPMTEDRVQSWADYTGLSFEVARGGVHTMYPEYQHRVRELMRELD